MNAIGSNAMRMLWQCLAGEVELAQADPALLENLRARRVHAVALVVDDFANATLHNLDRAQEARARVTVDDCVGAYTIPASLEERVLFSVEAEAVGDWRVR
jgi:hypothetical protein